MTHGYGLLLILTMGGMAGFGKWVSGCFRLAAFGAGQGPNVQKGIWVQPKNQLAAPSEFHGIPIKGRGQ